MRTVIQRVSHASVTINGICKSAIKQGILILLGVEGSDNEEDIKWLCHKIVNLRIFDDENGIMNKSIRDLLFMLGAFDSRPREGHCNGTFHEL